MVRDVLAVFPFPLVTLPVPRFLILVPFISHIHKLLLVMPEKDIKSYKKKKSHRQKVWTVRA